MGQDEAITAGKTAMAAEEPERHLEEARDYLARFAASLPLYVSAAELGVREKAPYKALVVREALMWRTEETGRCACDMLERGDVTGGILLTRATLENAALIWRLRDVIQDRVKLSPAEIDRILSQLLLGSKQYPEPAAINILTLVDRLDRALGIMREGYDRLSEFAHPNYGGVAGLYSTIDKEKHTTKFGKRASAQRTVDTLVAPTLRASLFIFENTYNQISVLMPSWVAELTRI